MSKASEKPSEPKPQEDGRRSFWQRLFVRKGISGGILLPILAVFTALVIGAFIIAAAIGAVINPGMVKIPKGSVAPMIFAVALLAIVGLLLIIGGRIVQKKVDQDCPLKETSTSTRLKWILFAVVVIILIYTFCF